MRTDYGIIGPINMTNLPDEIKIKFTEDLPFINAHYYLDGRNQCSITQVPTICHRYMTYNGKTWLPNWSNELIDILLSECKKGNINNLSPDDYPTSALQIYEAFKNTSVQDKNVAVLGSVSPWIEALAIHCGAKSVTTIEYSKINIESPLINFLNVSDIKEEKYDIIVSFSSLEHDGLGRYGDPINPNGDVEAVSEAYEMLNTNGYFICGLPVGVGCIEGNWHRIYNQTRLDRLFNNFNKISSIPYPYKSSSNDSFYSNANFQNNDWKNQPVFILQKV